MVSVNSHLENRFLAQNADADGPSWIGLMCFFSFLSCRISWLSWPDGTRTSNFSSDIGERIPPQAAAALFNNAAWRARDTDDVLSYICEKDDPCVATPCLNGGTCRFSRASGTRTCECPPGTVGDNCDCDNSLCENGTPCLIGFNETTCGCGGRYNGTYCSDHRSHTAFRQHRSSIACHVRTSFRHKNNHFQAYRVGMCTFWCHRQC